jgi:hypothetical protein
MIKAIKPVFSTIKIMQRGMSMANSYSFLEVDPLSIMSKDEIEHFEEAMSPHNTDLDSKTIDLGPYVSTVVGDFERLLFGETEEQHG